MTTQQAFALALQHHQAGRLTEAAAGYRLALQHDPGFAIGYNNLGVLLAGQGLFEEASAAFRRAFQLQPGYLEARVNLGVALINLAQLDEAFAVLQQALQVGPNHPETYNNLGVVLTRQGRNEEALASYLRALELKPNYPEAYGNLGLALAGCGRIDEAVEAFRRALQSKPDNPETHYNLGTALVELGQCHRATAAFRRALQLKPDYAVAWNNLGNTLKDEGELEQALAAYRQAADLQPADPMFLSNLILALPLCPTGDERSIRDEQVRWNRLYVEPLRPSWRPHGNDRDPRRRLKIGYVSPDFRSHAASFFLTPLLEAHDHGQYEIHGYASVKRPDAVTERVRQATDVWRDVRALSDAQLAGQVRKDGIDILVDLAMHSADNRLPAFAHRAAPVQVSWLAYPGSTGLEAIDYRLTDAQIDPAGKEDDGLGGEAIRLPDAWCCYAPIEEFPEVSPLPAIRNGFVTYGSLNQFSKIPEGLLHCWARLLKAVPAARLLIVCPEGQAEERTRTLFAAHEIAPDRVELVAPCPWADYTRLFARIDLALDSYPCNGMTTTCHALWMGVPVLTLAGIGAVSRAGHSLLHTIGLPDGVAWSEEEYLRLAEKWAGDIPRLAELRQTLRLRMQASPLMDSSRFARNIEAAYRTLWQRWCAEK